MVSNGIEVTDDIEYASRIVTEQFAIEFIGFLKNFFDTKDKGHPKNKGKVIPPLYSLGSIVQDTVRALAGYRMAPDTGYTFRLLGFIFIFLLRLFWF